MTKFVVSPSGPLKGNVKISGAKNAVLPILAASLLTEEECTIKSVPNLKDVSLMFDILKEIGAQINFSENKEELKIKTSEIINFEESYDLAGKMRASFLVMGPLLTRCKKARIPLPGGCKIGTRPIDLHLKGFAALGAKISQEHGYIEVYANNLKGNKIYLDFPSVGATENIIMAAALVNGKTTIENAAAEPEIADLASFINNMGGKITGAGTSTIEISGVKRLFGTEHKVIPDRIEAGTFMVASAITGGDIILENVDKEHLKPVIAKLSEANVKCKDMGEDLRVFITGKLKPINLKTMPFPGFPTDMQAQFMSLMCKAEGTSLITETVFENRFMHAGELRRMGANIKIESRNAVIEGVKKLTGTQVKATDLRAGSALIISALAAFGKTEISDIYHIERGYYKIEEKLKRLGAEIEKVNAIDTNKEPLI